MTRSDTQELWVGSTQDQRAAAPGRNALGSISISDSVVAKIAAKAAAEIPDAGAAATSVLGNLPGAGLLGARSTDLDALPKVQASVDGALAVLTISMSVRWPCSVAGTTHAVREHVRRRVTELTGLDVTEVRISVTDLATSLAPPPRVR